MASLNVMITNFKVFFKYSNEDNCAKPWNVDVGDVELIDGEVDGVKLVQGGAAGWSGVHDLSGVSPLRNSMKNYIMFHDTL